MKVQIVNLFSIFTLPVANTRTYFAQRTIAGKLASRPQYSLFSVAIKEGDLYEFLDCPEFCDHYTIFAPADDAFDRFPHQHWFEQPNLYRTHLKQLVQYHMLRGRIYEEDFVDRINYQTLQGEYLVASVSDGFVVTLNSFATVLGFDNWARNGLIQGVSEVLLPHFSHETLLDLVRNKTKLFYEAVMLSGNVELLQNKSTFTVLAPSDAVMMNSSLMSNGTDAILSRVGFHIIPDLILTESDLLESQSQYPSLLGTVVSFSFGTNFIASDILGSNGIMHIIDRVHPPIPDIWGLISQTPELSSFEKIIQSAGLISKLQEQGPFTLFAPTNNATDPRQNHRVWDRLEKRDLEYYLVEGRHRREDLSDRLFRTVSRDYVLVDVRLDGTVILNSRVQVRSFNHEASNGVIHFISERLTRPLDLVATARSEGLTSFVRALEVAGLTEAFQEEGPYTMFAWSNAAWIHLDPSQASELLNDREKMRQVVLYHIIPRYLLFDNLLEGSYLTLLQSEITVSFDYQDESDSSFRVKIDDANLSGIDIIASNGCLHRVSRVLHLR